jgi:uncharacterized protein (TIGR02145 family)
MKNKSLLLAIAFIVFAISVQAQVKPKTQLKPVNKQKVLAKPGASAKVTLKDSRDGKTYKTVKIGTQTWMAENLAYRDSIGCWAYDGDTANVEKYGYLYDWETANKVCPTGWHLPSEAEWIKLTTYLGEGEKACMKMKSTSGWNDYNGKTGNGANTSGFTGLPGGFREYNGTYLIIGSSGDWWSSENTTERAFYRGLSVNGRMSWGDSNKQQSGMSVRCLRNL